MDFGFEAKDKGREEIPQVLLLHADKTHNMKIMPPDIMPKVQKAIRQ
jgi:predicted small metal-binding protein